VTSFTALIKGYELDRILFKVKKNEEFRRKFIEDFDSACEGFSLSPDERQALRNREYARLYDLGAKDELILVLARLSRDAKKKT